MASAWGDSWGTCSGSGSGGSGGSGSGSSGYVTLLQKLKTVLDRCRAVHPSVPIYYYRENPEGTDYPKFYVESCDEDLYEDLINSTVPGIAKAEFTIAIVGESPIGPLEDIMGIIRNWLTPTSMATIGSGYLWGDPVLIPVRYKTEQLVERSFNGKQMEKVSQKYHLIFGGSF